MEARRGPAGLGVEGSSGLRSLNENNEMLMACSLDGMDRKGMSQGYQELSERNRRAVRDRRGYEQNPEAGQSCVGHWEDSEASL